MKHISHYVDKVMHLLALGNGNIAVITNLLQRDGCNPEDVMPCVYGACAYIVQSNMLTEQQAIERDEEPHTKDEVLKAFTLLCPELSQEVVESLYDYMIRKVWLIEKGDYVFCGTRMMINHPIRIDTK
ncbi:MAG: hypothetical protein IJ155_08300 [Prevotella sp.]|nr:hypothetical protein [Prevotella sp.]